MLSQSHCHNFGEHSIGRSQTWVRDLSREFPSAKVKRKSLSSPQSASPQLRIIPFKFFWYFFWAVTLLPGQKISFHGRKLCIWSVVSKNLSFWCARRVAHSVPLFWYSRFEFAHTKISQSRDLRPTGDTCSGPQVYSGTVLRPTCQVEYRFYTRPTFVTPQPGPQIFSKDYLGPRALEKNRIESCGQ